MPDTSVRVFKGEYPERKITETMKVGEKYLWIPAACYRTSPILYVVEEIVYRGRRRVVHSPIWPIPGVEHG